MLIPSFLAVLILDVYVALSDPGFMQFSHIIEQSPRNWETSMRLNVFLTILHTQNIHHHVWKTFRATCYYIIGLQSRGEDHEIEKKLWDKSVP